MPYEITYQEISPNIGNPITIFSEVSSIDIQPVVDGATYKISVAAINSIGMRGPTVSLPNYTVIGKLLPPADITGLSVLTTKFGNYVRWNENTDIDLQEYEIRKGISWDLGTTVFSGSTSTSFTDTNLDSGVQTYFGKAKDTTGNYSINPTSGIASVDVIGSTKVSYSIDGSNYVLSWTEPYSTYAIKEYEIRSGSTFETSTLIGHTFSTIFQAPTFWGGDMSFYITPKDIALNLGTVESILLSIAIPIPPVITAQVIDNNVLFYWTDSKTTLPVNYYEIRRGSTFSTATVVGTKSGLFTSLFETNGGNYTYWIVGIDSAGNYGTPGSIYVSVNQPPDYILNSDIYSTFTGTLSNAVQYFDEVSIPHNTTETWAEHFTSRSWATPQDQIDAGYTVFSQPVPSSGFYEETWDYGTVLASNKVSVLYGAQIVGTPTVTITISVKALLGDAWTDYVGVDSVYATNFRYVKVKLLVESSNNKDFLDLTTLNIRLDAKVKNDGGTVYADAADVGGTQVNFNVPFVDVAAVNGNYLGLTLGVDFLIDFTDVPNPTGFKVLLYNSVGSRISGNVSWSAKGY